MKALVLWSDNVSENLGVRALGQGSARLITRAFPGAEVSFRNYGRGDGPPGIAHTKQMTQQVARGRGILIDWLRTFDLVLDTRAGDSFADIYGMRRLVTLTLTAELVHRAGVPLVLGPQTIGPFTSRRGRWLATRSLRQAKLVMARDPESAAAAAALRRPADVSTTDVVFELDEPAPSGSRDVVLNPSGLLWYPNGHVDSDRYRQIVSELCRSLGRAGRKVTLMAHVLDSPRADNDVPVLRELADRVGGVAEVVVPGSLEQARGVLASADVVIGSRMHACLNALSVGRPAVPLAYSRKFAPLLRDLGWPHTVELNEGLGQVEAVLRAVEHPRLLEHVQPVRDRAAERLAVAERALATVA